MPAVTRALASARVASFAGLALTGIASAATLSAAALIAPIRWSHMVLAEALLAICVAELAVAFVSGAYRAGAGPWLARVAVLGAAMVAYVLGSAAGPGEAGEEGLAHFGRALGLVAAPAWWIVLAAHVAAAIAVAALGVFLFTRAGRPGSEGRGRRAAAAAVTFVAALALSLPAVLAARDLPAVGGAEAAHAPWPARVLSPWETSGDVVIILLVVFLTAGLAMLPLLDRGGSSPAWRRVAGVGLGLGALAFTALTIVVSFGPPGH